MPTYKAYFHTDADYAAREFAADTPAQALALARRFYDDDPSDIMFESGGMPVIEISVHDADSNRLAVWYDDDMRLRLAASDLLEAAQGAVYALDKNEEGAGPNTETALKNLRAAIAKAKGGAG